MDKVSIIVPIYNGEKVIDRCLKSILNQEYENIEVILINDGSKDSTKDLLDSYSDSRLKIIHNQNKGVSYSRNIGLSLASGKYIQFVDIDDYLPANSTSSLLKEMKENDVDIVVGGFYRVNKDKLAKKSSINNSGILSLEEYADKMKMTPADFYYGVLWNKLYKKEIIDKYHIRMDEGLNYCEDFLFNLEYLLHTKYIYTLNVPVYYYEKTEGSLVYQSLSFKKIVNTKAKTFEYYNNFYKKILNEEEYEKERLSIARYLIMPAIDEVVLSLSPNTKKLGEEKINLNFKSEDNILSIIFNLKMAFEIKLDVIANKYNLDIKDLKVLLALDSIEKINSLADLALYVDISEVDVAISISKLRILNYISTNLIDGFSFELKDKAYEVIEDIKKAQDELFNYLTKDIDIDKINIFNEVSKIFKDNLLNYLYRK